MRHNPHFGLDSGASPTKSCESMRLPQCLRTGANAILAVFYPEVCCLCEKRKATPAEHFVCKQCAQQIEFVGTPICERCGRTIEGEASVAFECSNCRSMDLYYHSARSVLKARGPILKAIHLYKYSRAMWLEPFLTSPFVEGALPSLEGLGLSKVIPVPLFPAKARERGFNQAERLAKALSEALSIPLNCDAVKRPIPTPTQTSLGRDERQANVRGAFSARGKSLKGLSIVLVDDVFTTGATANECARALKKAGAAEVRVWTLGRATDAFDGP